MKDREKEIRYLMYLKAQLIKDTKKELQALRQELQTINGTKSLERDKSLTKKRGSR